jgi:hypothetical protein
MKPNHEESTRTKLPVRIDRQRLAKLHEIGARSGKTASDVADERLGMVDKIERMIHDREEKAVESGDIDDIVDLELKLTKIHELRAMRTGHSNPGNSLSGEQLTAIITALKPNVDPALLTQLLDARSDAKIASFEKDLALRSQQSRQPGGLEGVIDEGVKDVLREKVKDALMSGLGEKPIKGVNIGKVADRIIGLLETAFEKGAFTPRPEQRIIPVGSLSPEEMKVVTAYTPPAKPVEESEAPRPEAQPKTVNVSYGVTREEKASE